MERTTHRGRQHIEDEMKEIADSYENDFETAMCNLAALQLEVLLDIRNSIMHMEQGTPVIVKAGSKI